MTSTWIGFYFHGGDNNLVTVSKNHPWPMASVMHSKDRYSAATMIGMINTLVHNGYRIQDMVTNVDGTVFSVILVK